MPRISHGAELTLDNLRQASASLESSIAATPEAFAAVLPVDLQDFDYLFPDLQNDSDNLLAVTATTRNDLVALGMALQETGDDPVGDSSIPAIFTYFGQFVDHDVTLEVISGSL